MSVWDYHLSKQIGDHRTLTSGFGVSRQDSNLQPADLN